MHPDIDSLMIACLRHVHHSAEIVHDGYRKVSLHHPIFWLVDKPNDLPGWMLSGDGIRQIPILLPDLGERLRITRAALQLSSKTPIDKETLKEIVNRFAGVSEGLSIRSILDINKLVIAGDVNPERVVESARQYRLGITENPWQDPELRDRIKNGRETLEGLVYGQEKAIARSLDILVRSAMNMTYAHTKDGGSGPRGVLFFAGATGVGKTELAKRLAQLVFGTAERIIRFDMSEFAQAHTEARLLGAPPSYIGHGAGGELTNAIRKQPHSVVLFDEIEKAHPAILDKFLQILSDGRLTDGSGDTVLFTETIIVFTSNEGADLDQHIL
jgi:ATP-dependent Clp protease ATP-binding subunit ClpA